jgi:hypothetical protein
MELGGLVYKGRGMEGRRGDYQRQATPLSICAAVPKLHRTWRLKMKVWSFGDVREQRVCLFYISSIFTHCLLARRKEEKK